MKFLYLISEDKRNYKEVLINGIAWEEEKAYRRFDFECRCVMKSPYSR
jgi:hypothetical protein